MQKVELVFFEEEYKQILISKMGTLYISKMEKNHSTIEVHGCTHVLYDAEMRKYFQMPIYRGAGKTFAELKKRVFTLGMRFK